MTNISKTDAIKIAYTAAKSFQENLENKNLLFLFTDKHKKAFSLEVTIRPYHFKHLTGLDPDNKIGAIDFYHRCLQRRLSQGDIKFSENGTTQMKLEVLPFIVSNNLGARMLGDFSGAKINLYTEKLVGNTSACVGFVSTKDSEYAPNTLLNVDIRQITTQPYRIIATFKKSINDEIYSELVYKARKLDWDKIKFPEEYSYLIPMLNQSP